MRGNSLITPLWGKAESVLRLSSESVLRLCSESVLRLISESVLRLFRVMESMEIGNKDTGQVFYWIYRSKMVMESMEIGDKRRRTSVLLYLKKRIGHGE